MDTNTRQAKQKVITAIEKIVQASKELSQAESEYLGIQSEHRSNTLKLVCDVTPDEQTGTAAEQTSGGPSGRRIEKLTVWFDKSIGSNE